MRPSRRTVETARKQLDDEKACYSAATSGKDAEAMAAARKAIAEYPQSTLARACMLNVLSRQKASPDTILTVANEILAIDPRSRTALGNAYEAQNKLGQTDAALNTLVRLLAADPTNTSVQTEVVRQLALNKKYDMADSVVTEALEGNPGEPQLLTWRSRSTSPPSGGRRRPPSVRSSQGGYGLRDRDLLPARWPAPT